MNRLWTSCFVMLASLTLASSGFANPPAHAPAHGHRAKPKAQPTPVTRAPSGVEFVFDSERGISISVGIPGVYFHSGSFYRLHDGHWQISLRTDGGWSAVKSDKLPDAVRKAHPQPGPAKHKKHKR